MAPQTDKGDPDGPVFQNHWGYPGDHWHLRPENLHRPCIELPVPIDQISPGGAGQEKNQRNTAQLNQLPSATRRSKCGKWKDEISRRPEGRWPMSAHCPPHPLQSRT